MVGATQSALTVHYRCWDSKFDECIPITSDRVRKPYSQVRPFPARGRARQGLRADGQSCCPCLLPPQVAYWRKLAVGDELEYKHGGKWFSATVLEVHSGGHKLTICVKDMNGSTVQQRKVVESTSDDICPSGTHVKQQASNARAAPKYGPYSTASRFSPWYGRSHSLGTPPAPGAVGLSNLGACAAPATRRRILTVHLLSRHRQHLLYE